MTKPEPIEVNWRGGSPGLCFGLRGAEIVLRSAAAFLARIALLSLHCERVFVDYGCSNGNDGAADAARNIGKGEGGLRP